MKTKKLVLQYKTFIFSVAVATIAILLIIGFMSKSGLSVTHQIRGLIQATNDFESNVIYFHLRLEEFISGDPRLTSEEIWDYLDKAEELRITILEGGKNGHITLKPIDDTFIKRNLEKLRTHIDEMRIIGQRREANTITSKIGSPLDEAFDEHFNSIVVATQGIRKRLNKVIDKKLLFFQNMAIIIGFFVIFSAFASCTILLRNIHKRKITLQDLQESEMRHGSIMHAAYEAIITINQDGIVMDINPSVERIFGYTPDEAVGKDIANLVIPHEFRDKHRAGLKTFIKTGKGNILNKRMEMTAIGTDGKKFPVSIFIINHMTKNRHFFTAFIRDITLRKQTEYSLLKAKAKAEEATKAKTSFLAMVSHEIRTPMSGIITMGEMLDETHLSAAQKRMSSIIHESSVALLTIVNDILDFSKIESGKLELTTTDFLLRNLASDLTSLVKSIASAKGLTLTMVVDPDVPKCFHGDRNRLRQILLNLTNNAVKFTDKGNIDIEIKCTGQTDGNADLLFLVKDTGIGIPEDKQAFLFEPYSQADYSLERRILGTGLGLSICKALLDLMGGEIGVESKWGEGSTFWFKLTLPIANELEIDDVGYDKPSPSNSHIIVSPGQTPLILVAEDNPTNQTVMKLIMERLGLSADFCDNGVEACKLLQEKSYDLLLTDCQMPEMDGLQLTQHIRKQESETGKPRMPVIAISADARPSMLSVCSNAGIDDFIKKPVTLSTMEKTLGKWLSQAVEAQPAQDETAAHIGPPLTLDTSYLLDGMGVSRDKLKQVLDEFVETTTPDIEAMLQALDNADWKTVGKKAHTTSGAADIAGATRLAEICSGVEQAIIEKDHELAKTLAASVDKAMAEVVATIDKL